MRRCVAAAPEAFESRMSAFVPPSGGWRIAVLAGVRLVASEVVALDGVEDLGERGLDVRGVEVVAGIGDRDCARRVRAARLVHVAVEPAEQRHEGCAQRARSDRRGRARDGIDADEPRARSDAPRSQRGR
jgi:hypothetical protein